jgi:hypothetical protein
LAAGWGEEWRALTPRDPSAAAPTHLQPGFAIHAMHALVIHDETFPGDQRVQPPIAIPRTDRGVRLQPCEELGVIHTAAALIPPRRRAQADDATGASQTGRMRVHEPPHRHALRHGAYHFFATTAFIA